MIQLWTNTSSISKRQRTFIRALACKKGRDASNCCLVEGIRCITAFLQAGQRPVYLYIAHEHASLVQPKLAPYGWDASLNHPDIETTIVTAQELQSVSAQSTTSGILAVFKQLPEYSITKHVYTGVNDATEDAVSDITDNVSTTQKHNVPESGLVLAGLQDPGNVGTLLRTAAALAVPLVICIDSVDLYNPKVIQASAGAIALVPCVRMSWQEFTSLVPCHKRIALVPQGGQEITRAHSKTFLIVGNEGNGLSQEWLDDCGQRGTLDMPSQSVESLNAAVAGAIALYLAHGYTKG